MSKIHIADMIEKIEAAGCDECGLTGKGCVLDEYISPGGLWWNCSTCVQRLAAIFSHAAVCKFCRTILTGYQMRTVMALSQEIIEKQGEDEGKQALDNIAKYVKSVIAQKLNKSNEEGETDNE